jgi:hypothetical protein
MGQFVPDRRRGHANDFEVLTRVKSVFPQDVSGSVFDASTVGARCTRYQDERR